MHHGHGPRTLSQRELSGHLPVEHAACGPDTTSGVVQEEPEDGRTVELEDADLRAAALTCARDDPVGLVVGAADGADVHPAGEGRGVSEEPTDRSAVGAEDAHLRPASRAGTGDDLVHAVAVDVTGGDAHAAAEPLGIREEPAHRNAVGAEDPDV